MKFKIFLLFLFGFLVISKYSFTSQFNYGSEFAAKSPNAHKALINALEKSGDRIFGVGVHGIIIYSDDEGETWSQAESVPFTKTLTDISCPTRINVGPQDTTQPFFILLMQAKPGKFNIKTLNSMLRYCQFTCMMTTKV